nr:PREDICTED: uncharacterized protein LOC105662428 [Megachile rotundata]
MCFQKRLRNGKLLIAAGEGKLEEVKKLVKEGADINFSDTEGNTVLHYAVESCNLEVVQHVINEMYVDIDIENNENRTPLNIAKESKKQDIMEAIEEKVLCNALNNLETVISSNTINESILQVETDVKGKIIKKIQVSLQALEELTKSEEDIKKFTHKNANVFLLFLEAFALQDVEINNEIEKAQKDELIKCFGQKNYELIRSLRTRLVHPKDTNMIIEPKNLQKLTKMHSSVAKVFISLKNYAEEVSESLNKKQSKSDIKDLTEILLDSEIHKSKSKLTKNIYNLFERLVKVAYSTNVKQEELEEAMFDLIVNIIPFLSQEGVPENLQKLKDLRNELFHNFHEYKNLKVRKLELKKSISNLRSDIFKYYYSQRVHDVLQCSSCCIDSEGIKKDLDEKSRILDNKFFTELSHDVPPEEGESFEYNFEKSLFPKQNDIQVLVDQYFKFMTIIDSWKEEEINQFVNEDEETTISEQYRELSDIQKREIFDDFVQLKQIVQNFDEDYKKEKQEELRKKLGSEAKRQDKREEATEYYNKAMVFLKEVPSEIDTEQFLLVLSREAYTKSLLQEFEESYEKYENLWKEIVKFALYLTKDIPRYDKKISIDAIKSQRYVDLLALSNEHKKYLDILEIRMSMGFQKEYQKEGGKKELNRKVAYEIYKEVYNIQKLKSGMEIKSTLGTMRRMAKLNYLIANEKYTKHKYKDALRYYYESLAGEIRILKIQEENYSKFHPVIRETNLKFIKKILDFIAQINDRLGDLEQQNKLKENTIILKYYNTAQTIFDKLYDVDKHNLYLEKSQKIIKKIQNLKQSSTRKNKREWNLEWTAKRRCLNN